MPKCANILKTINFSEIFVMRSKLFLRSDGSGGSSIYKHSRSVGWRTDPASRWLFSNANISGATGAKWPKIQHIVPILNCELSNPRYNWPARLVRRDVLARYVKNWFLGSRSKTTEKLGNLKALRPWKILWSTILYFECICEISLEMDWKCIIFLAKKFEVFPVFFSLRVSSLTLKNIKFCKNSVIASFLRWLLDFLRSI